MKEIVIISGKGGTGKTSITACFAELAENPILCDCDVDAADLHLLMQPDIREENEFYGGGIASIRSDDCVQCGLCSGICKFNAIEDFVVNQIACEGCGVCVDFCPEKAIDFPERKCGDWFVSNTKAGTMVHARLGIAEENSGRLVSVIRKHTQELAEEKGNSLILTDGPPGIGCPVIASITGADLLVMVVEPTVSGVHDLNRVAQLAQHFKIPSMLLVNKYDLNAEIAGEIEKQSKLWNMTTAGRIPFDVSFTRAMVDGKTVLEQYPQSRAAEYIRRAWENVLATLSTVQPQQPLLTKL